VFAASLNSCVNYFYSDILSKPNVIKLLKIGYVSFLLQNYSHW